MAAKPKPLPVPPTCFVPSCPADFVGQAGVVAEILMKKAVRLKAAPNQLPMMLASPPTMTIASSSIDTFTANCSGVTAW